MHDGEMNTSQLRQHLSLLPILDALLDEVHVSRAAAQCHLSQSAVSHALQQLREIYSDPLLTRGQSGAMLLTPLAKQIKPQVKDLMRRLYAYSEAAHDFDPQTTTQVFTLAVSEYISSTCLSELLIQLKKIAPCAGFRVKTVDAMGACKTLEALDCDVCIGHFPEIPPQYYQQQLFVDTPVCCYSKQHHKIKRLTKQYFIQAQHVLVSYKQDSNQSLLMRWLHQQGLSITPQIIVADAQVALAIAAKTPLIASVFSRAAEMFDHEDLVVKQAPHDVMQIGMYQYWHKINHQRQDHCWLRQQILALYQGSLC